MYERVCSRAPHTRVRPRQRDEETRGKKKIIITQYACRFERSKLKRFVT